MNYTAGFIGTGNMGSALLRATVKKTDSIAVSNRTKAKAESLAKEYKLTCSHNIDIAENAKYIFLGVKPQMMKEVIDEISPALKSRKDDFNVVTMAAGVSTEKVCEYIGADVPVIRIMPNTPVAVGKGIILYCANSLVDCTDEFTKLLEDAGTLDEISENLMDAASALTGCTPAWIYMFIESLADGGVLCGVPRQKALAYACDSLIGAAELVKNSGKHPEQLKDEVGSPGGTTIEGVNALEKGNFRAAVIDAVNSAYKKSKNMVK